MKKPTFEIRAATVDDVAVILELITELAVYEKLAHQVSATEEQIRKTLFGARPVAEALLGFENDQPVAFALFFHSYSSFLARPGIYLEDLFVRAEHRGKGYGKAMLLKLAQIANERDCGRLEWVVLDWNEPAIQFYRKLGAVAMDEWKIFQVTGDNLKRLGEAAD